MFGGNIDPPKYVKHKRPKPMKYDIQMPTPFWPGVYGHLGRKPNTNYHVQYLQYKQRNDGAHNQMLAAEKKRLLQDATSSKYDSHVERKVLLRHIQERYQEKVRAYDDGIDERRKKLRELLCREEREFTQETIDSAQRGVDNRMQEMKIKAQELKAQREHERMQVVHRQRMMQMIEDCDSLRPFIFKRNLLDSKNSQLQQMKDNETKRELEKEINGMWHELALKQTEAKMEREIQDALKQKMGMEETIKVWEKQIEGKRLLQIEKERVAMEDREEMLRIEERLKQEEKEKKEEKKRKKDIVVRELKEQVVAQKKYAAERKKAEDELSEAFSRMAMLEVQKERDKIKDTTSQAKKETEIYKAHLKELDAERKQEERALNEMLEVHRVLVDKKRQEVYCALKAAKDKLKREVMDGRAEQLEYKKRQAEEKRKLKEIEDETMRRLMETNEKLQKERDRLEAEAERIYREELKQQIKSNAEKRQLERERLQMELAENQAEEERRHSQILDVFETRLSKSSFKHPFRRMMDWSECVCPKNPTD